MKAERRKARIRYAAFMRTIIKILSLTFLTSCIGCAFSDSHIDNQTGKDIYVILSIDTSNFKNSIFKFFINKSQSTHYIIDSSKHTGTFLVKPGQKLQTYEGPGSDPVKLLSSIKIITSNQIIDFKNKSAIKNAMDKDGLTYKLTIK